MFKRWKIEQDYRDLCAIQYAAEPRISEAASLLVLAQTGVLVEDADIGTMADRLSGLAQELNLQPEEIQAALGHHDPRLRQEAPLAL